MCALILCVTLYEKFGEGGWVTSAITLLLIGLCFLIRRHYENVRRGFRNLDDVLATLRLPEGDAPRHEALDRKRWTAILAVPAFSGYGFHHILSIKKLFPEQFGAIMFVSAAVIDSGNFKGAEEVRRLENGAEEDMRKYMEAAKQLGFQCDYRIAVGTEGTSTIEGLCRELSREFPKSIVFAGKLIFRKERWYQRLLHNETATGLQRRLQLDGVPTMLLPIRA
jgi:hypothetical protein